MKYQINKVFPLFIALFLNACGGGSSTSEDMKEQLRFINAIKSESAVDIRFGNNLLLEELAYGETSGFIEVEEGDVQLRVNSSEKVIPILSAEQNIESGSKQTFLLFDENSSVALQEIKEEAKAPLVGEVNLRFINLSEEKSSVDIYILFPDEDLDDQVVAASALNFKSASEYIAFREGNFDIVYVDEGTKNIVRRSRSIEFVSGKVYTHVLLDQTGALLGQTSRIFEDIVF